MKRYCIKYDEFKNMVGVEEVPSEVTVVEEVPREIGFYHLTVGYGTSIHKLTTTRQRLGAINNISNYPGRSSTSHISRS